MYKKNRIHFVGIGGIGMSGIAEVLLNLGYPVSGSDLKRTPTTQKLKKKGAIIHYGHKKDNLGETEVLVVSSAIKKNNPELIEAHNKKIPVIQRAEMLAELMRFSKYGIAVAGTHGKTTTTSLVASTLYEAGFDPTMIIGGKVNNFRSNARLGKGDFMVAEADESDGSFLKLSPSIAVMTSIDREHMDFYKDFHEVTQAFLSFAQKVPFYGAVICCWEHPVVRSLIPQIEKRVLTYGFSDEAQFVAKNITFENGGIGYDYYYHGEKKGRIQLNLLGEHNVLNSLAVLAIAQELNIPLSKTQKAFRSFKGIGRRCEILLKNSVVTVLDDYGHHPEEIRATVKAIRGAYAGRLVTLFQPHRYTRTRDLFEDFLGAFERTNVLLITDIYAAGETAIPGVDAEKLCEAIKKTGMQEVYYIPKTKKIVDDVVKLIQPGDVLLTLGAGDVTKIGRECAKKLKNLS